MGPRKAFFRMGVPGSLPGVRLLRRKGVAKRLLSSMAQRFSPKVASSSTLIAGCILIYNDLRMFVTGENRGYLVGGNRGYLLGDIKSTSSVASY